MKYAITTAAVALTALMLSGSAGIAAPAGTVAFLMPDQASTRYEEHDWPGFQARDEDGSAPTAQRSIRTPTATLRCSSSSSTR